MYLKGIVIITGFLALGNVCTLLTGNVIPGSVYGMIFLFLALYFRIVRPDDVRPVANFLIGNMSLFFVPASIGIMEQWGLIKANLAEWLAVIVISTLAVLLSVGYIQDKLMQIQSYFKKKNGYGK